MLRALAPPLTDADARVAKAAMDMLARVRRGARVNGTAEAALAEQSVSAPVWCDHAQCGCAAGACSAGWSAGAGVGCADDVFAALPPFE